MTSTITARLDLPRGHVEVHTEGTAAECYAVLAGLDIVAQALGIDHAPPVGHRGPEVVTVVAPTVNLPAPAPLTDEDRETLRDPGTLKNQAKAKRAATPKAGRPTGPKSGPHAKGTFAAPGTALHAILDTIADHGGRWEGTSSDLGAAAGCTHQSGPKMIRILADAGLCTIERSGPRTVTAIALTGDGWAHLGRGKPTDIHSLVLTPPEPPATSDAPKVIDLATLPREGRKPFDPDAARAAAAGAL